MMPTVKQTFNYECGDNEWNNVPYVYMLIYIAQQYTLNANMFITGTNTENTTYVFTWMY